MPRPVKLLLELSGEHPTLPRAEALALLETLGTVQHHQEEPGVLLADAEGVDAQAFASRVALTHTVNAHWFTAAATPRAIVPPFFNFNLEGATFAVRAKRYQNAHPEMPLQDLERAIGRVLAETGKVDLSAPATEVRVLVSEFAHAGGLLARVDRTAFEARHVKHRPYFSPISLHPRYARALVNLARVRPGDRVVDPFSGTGGTALEAALVGARVFASDLDLRMVAGTEETLTHFGVRAEAVEHRDVGELPEFCPGADAIVTDPPYGRSATTEGEGIDALYERFFLAAREALRPGGRVALAVPHARHLERGAQHLTLEDHHVMRVHRSLDRHFAVFRKPE